MAGKEPEVSCANFMLNMRDSKGLNEEVTKDAREWKFMKSAKAGTTYTPPASHPQHTHQFQNTVASQKWIHIYISLSGDTRGYGRVSSDNHLEKTMA